MPVFSRVKGRSVPIPPSPEPVPERLIYAIGDVHGRLDLLCRAEALITEHLAGRPGWIIMLGDYVDRGPDSRGVVELLIQAQASGRVICLKGNHEELMVRALRGDAAAANTWLWSGGDETLASYGLAELGQGCEVPQAHLDWMSSLPSCCTDGRRIYVHAGLMPGVCLAAQREEHMLWIRERFLRAKPGAFPDALHIVHGHTPYVSKSGHPEPQLLPHRTNLDTAAFATGVLTIGVFDPDRDGGPLELLRAAVP